MREILCTVIDGHPWSVEKASYGRGSGEDAKLLGDLPEDDQQTVLQWIKDNLIPIKSPNYWHDSHQMIQYIQEDTGIALSNNQVKDAMMECGYFPSSENSLNWNFSVSETSPAFQRKRETISTQTKTYANPIPKPAAEAATRLVKICPVCGSTHLVAGTIDNNDNGRTPVILKFVPYKGQEMKFAVPARHAVHCRSCGYIMLFSRKPEI